MPIAELKGEISPSRTAQGSAIGERISGGWVSMIRGCRSLAMEVADETDLGALSEAGATVVAMGHDE